MNGKVWTQADDELLRKGYPDRAALDLARQLGRSLSSVYGRAKKLGLAKSQAFQESDRSGRVQRGRQHPRMQATQFKKGAKAWNEGKKGSCGTHPNCRATQFAKGELQGRAAEVVKPIGAERIAEGVLQRKVNNNRPFQRRWRSVHALVWEAEHGAIPEGHKVIFKAGMHTTVAEQITLDRLELVTNAELMRRNSYHTRYPKEVGLLIQLKGALNRKINHKLEAQHEEQD